ncbi:hypothetical protein Patl1_03925 [Pistacia atlantica]|uniref:Uncharacterized protein n=1 Tax=Pistacia atlantica TaxID=434234 RepID=A0ACC1BW92_9ROSI|nr:hypothetical protein Patl1_03925 [Pistacia atlantica]
MENRIYNLLTIDCWESLNHMDYTLASLRPVHGKLALRFLNWVMENPGLELTHLTHLLCLTAHVLVKARMYDDAKKECGVGSVWLVFREMLARKICPNVATFNVLINVLCVKGNLKKADYLVRKMEESGYVPNVVMYNTLLNWYFKMGRYKAAFVLIDHMGCKDIKADGGKIGIAIRVFDEMSMLNLSPNRITYNALIDGHCNKGNFEEALRLLGRTEAVGLRPNEVSYGALLNGLCKHDKFDLARGFLEKMRTDGMVIGRITYTSIIDGEWLLAV